MRDKYIEQRGGYADCERHLDAALAAPVRLRFETFSDAARFRARCYKLRGLERDHTKLIYTPDEEDLYGISIYDSLEILIDGTTCIIKRRPEPEIEYD